MNDRWELILDHYRNPRNYGSLPNADAAGKEVNILCGDEVEVQLKFDGNRIENIRFQGTGCAISKAATSLLTEHVKGKTVSQVKRIGEKDVFALLRVDVTSSRTACALLGLKALKKAIRARHGTTKMSSIKPSS